MLRAIGPLVALLVMTSAACGPGGMSDPGDDDDYDDRPSDDPIPTEAELQALRELAPETLPSPPPDPSNRVADDPAAAALGRKLFFETSFSGALIDDDNTGPPDALGFPGYSGWVSCASCHVPEAGFSDNRSPGQQISLAAGWGSRKTPSVLDVGHAKLIMWDGRNDTLYNQVFGPIESPLEMNSSRLFTAQEIYRLYKTEYEAVFGPMPPLNETDRFPRLSPTLTGCHPIDGEATAVCNGPTHGMPGDGAEFDSMTTADQDAITTVIVNMGKAIAAYERLLSCGAGRFDAWVHGDEDAMTAAEKRGALLFVGKAQCNSCHSGPHLSDQSFHNVGLAPAPVAFGFVDEGDRGAVDGIPIALASPLNVQGRWSDGDDGRLPESAAPELLGAFRTPTLRCVHERPSFMHTGQMRTLAEVVAFFSEGGHAEGYPGQNELEPVNLTAAEQADLVAFLEALEGPGPDQSLLTPH